MTSAPALPSKLRIDIAVCTFRRPELEYTLRSLAALTIAEDWDIRVIVADNDVIASAQALVAKLEPELPFPVSYVHCPASNISIARNACLDTGSGDFLAFLDDDETASPQWLAELMTVAKASRADAVLGPVRATYGDAAPRWMREGDFHSTFPVWVKGEIITGYTCNCLLRRASPRIAGRRFGLSRGRTGGEDTEYFTQVHRLGGKIAYAPEAWIYEAVPASRATFSWLAQRRFRVGQTHGHMIGRNISRLQTIKHIGLASAKASFCFAVAGFNAFSVQRRNRSLLRGIMHAGAIGGIVGQRELQQYGDPLLPRRRGNAA